MLSEALLGVVIGGAISFIATFFITFLEKSGERERFSSAITSEVKSIVYIAEKRKYKTLFQEVLRSTKITRTEPPLLKINIKNDYFPLFSNNLDKIGFLKNPKPEEVVRFYTLCKALLEDVRSMTEGEWHGLGPGHWIYALSNMILIYDEIVVLHNIIVKSREEVSWFSAFTGRFF